MAPWLPLLRWFAVRALLLLATLLAPGCGYSTYNIPPAELQRLTQLPPSLRGEHVRVYTPGVVPAATPNPPVAAAPPVPQPAPSPPEAAVNSELQGTAVPADEVSADVVEPVEPPVVVSVDLALPVPPTAPPLHARPAPVRLPPPVIARPNPRPPVPGHVAPPRAVPHLSGSHASAPTFHASGGHSGGLSGSHHSGGGGSGAAVGALVGAVVLIGLVAAIAETSEPTPFDGWIRTSPEHPVHLLYRSGWQRDFRLCDLKPTDIVDVRSAVMYDTEGAIERLETASAPSAPPPRLASPPASPSIPEAPSSKPPPTPPISPPPESPWSALSSMVTLDPAA